MKIKTLNLIAFGKFKNKTIEISDGLNLVFGANEAGKTTIQHFIEGMFFGFYKPYRKKRSFSDDYYRYRPRYGESYCGAMIIEDDRGETVRIERDFLKTRDGVRIYNQLTGEDISSAYPYDPVSKQYLPLGYGDFNAVRYNNTVNVKQMASKSDAHLAKEVNNQLVQLANNSTDELVIKKILDHIHSEKERIGTKNKSKSNYGKAIHEIQELGSALTESEKTYEHVRNNQRQIQKYRERITQAEEQCQAFQKQADKETREEQRVLNARLNELQEEIEEIESWLQEVEGHAGADRKKYGQIKTMESSLQALEDQLILIDEKIEALISQKSDSDFKCQEFDACLGGMTKQEIEEDYFNYCRKTYGDGPMLTANDMDEGNNTGEMKDWVDFSGINFYGLLSGMLAGFVITLIGLINPGQLLSVWPQIIVSFLGFLLCLGCLGCLVIQKKGENLKPVHEVWHYQEEEEENSTSVQPKQILEKYGMDDENAYFSFIDRCRDLFLDFEGLNNEREKINFRLEALKSEKEELEETQNHYQNAIAQLLEEANVDSVETYGQVCEISDEINFLRSNLESDRLLYNELSKRVIVSPNAAKTFYLTEQGGEMVKIQEAIEAYHHEMDRLIGENQLMMKNMINPVNIRERIETLQNRIHDYALEIKACDMAEKFFSSYFRRVHYTQAPDLNMKIGRFLECITRKYSEVHVDDQMNVKVVDPENGALLSIEQLSGGTVDQIYLSLRFGVADIFDSGHAMPILLDDPFVQYDDARKAEAVRMLSEISKDKQVILFTCTSDEKRIMDENHFAYIGIGI